MCAGKVYKAQAPDTGLVPLYSFVLSANLVLVLNWQRQVKGETVNVTYDTQPPPVLLYLYCIVSYKKYVMLDPLGVVTKTRTAMEEEEQAMAEAPNTIKTNEELQRLQADNYFYVPGIGEVPELDVPIALPNLLGKYWCWESVWKMLVDSSIHVSD